MRFITLDRIENRECVRGLSREEERDFIVDLCGSIEKMVEAFGVENGVERNKR